MHLLDTSSLLWLPRQLAQETYTELQSLTPFFVSVCLLLVAFFGHIQHQSLLQNLVVSDAPFLIFLFSLFLLVAVHTLLAMLAHMGLFLLLFFFPHLILPSPSFDILASLLFHLSHQTYHIFSQQHQHIFI
jgi:hypothetical protein